MIIVQDYQRDALYEYYKWKVNRRRLDELEPKEPIKEQLDNPELMTPENWAWYKNEA